MSRGNPPHSLWLNGDFDEKICDVAGCPGPHFRGGAGGCAGPDALVGVGVSLAAAGVGRFERAPAKEIEPPAAAAPVARDTPALAASQQANPLPELPETPDSPVVAAFSSTPPVPSPPAQPALPPAAATVPSSPLETRGPGTRSASHRALAAKRTARSRRREGAGLLEPLPGEPARSEGAKHRGRAAVINRARRRAETRRLAPRKSARCSPRRFAPGVRVQADSRPAIRPDSSRARRFGSPKSRR
jgi:hypothetical protein